MRTSATVALAAGVAFGLATLPTQADAATRHPAPGPARRALPSVESPDDAELPFSPDAWPDPRDIAPDVRRFAPGPDDDPMFSDDEEPVPGPSRPGASSSDERRHPRVHRHRRVHRHASPRDHRAVRVRHSVEVDRVPGHLWLGAVSVCVDVDVVAVVRVVIQVGCDCAPPPRHHVPPPPSPPRPSPPRRTVPVVAEHPRVRPPAPPKVPSPSVAPQTHRAVPPRAAVPHRRKNPLATLTVLIVLSVVISAGAGVAFAGR